jgi:asparagine synthase (glutamine-hydrolysing)
MCGIGGVVDFNGGVNPGTLVAMTGALGRRGPDANGIHIDGPCGFAHARLSIIDVEGSPQPMVAPDAGLSMVYNGELYNYQALRREAQALGANFATNGDTEVVLRWIAQEWTAALPRFDAMFAFAIWDSRNQRLLLARDALGEKPLFYATPAPGVLVFGSEIKVLLEHPLVSRALNMDAMRQAIRFRAIYGDESLHAGVRQLKPGGFLEFSRSGVTTGSFYDLVADTARDRRVFAATGDAELIAHGKSLFLQSVEERLVADVPVGAFLSGGLDSSLIVATMRQIRAKSEEIRTYSVGFEGDPNSELPFAQLVADALGTRHETITVGPEVYARRMAEFSACRDGPVSQPADIAIAEMSQVAKHHVKVALSGEGADEVFAGYPKYAFAKAPWLLRKALATVGPGNAAAIAGRLGIDARRTLVAARALAEPREVDRYTQWFSFFERGDLRRMLPGLGWSDADWEATIAEHQAVLARLDADSGHLLRMQMTDCLTWLPGNMLERGDRMTMAEGLEVRPPFLDKELSAFGLALPDRLKIAKGQGKWIVRQWAKDLIPDKILGRPKWGFRTPLNAWFKGPLRDFLTSYLTSSSGLTADFGDRAVVTGLLESHMSGKADASETLWTLLTAEVWYQDVYKARLNAVPQMAAV